MAVWTSQGGGPGVALPLDHGADLSGLLDDDHTQYLLLAGRSGGQLAYGGTDPADELGLQGSDDPGLGLIRAYSPIDFEDVSPAVALSPYSVRDASVQSFSAPYIGGTFGDLKTIDFSNAVFVYETLRGSPNITSLVSPGFAGFTLFQALPVLNSGSGASHDPLQALVLNAGPTARHANTGARTTNLTVINSAPQLNGALSGGTLTATNTTGLLHNPRWNTVAGSTVNLGTVRGLYAQTPSVALFGSSAGVETMTAYYGVDVEDLGSFGGTAPVAALRSAITSGTNQLFLENTGGAPSSFGSGLAHFGNNTPVQFGGTPAAINASLFWNSTLSVLELFFAANSGRLRLSNPASGRILAAGLTPASDEINWDVRKMAFGQSSAIGNQKYLFTNKAETIAVAGEYSGMLWTYSANDTLNAAISTYATMTLNAGTPTIGTGSLATNAILNIGGNPGAAATNRVGIRVLSNPSGGAGVNAALWLTAGRAVFDGIVDINNGVALGGGAGATLGTIGGSGPTVAAQAQWVQIEIAGVNHWIPAWI